MRKSLIAATAALVLTLPTALAQTDGTNMGGPETTGTTINDNDNRGMDWGWLGLLGLAGLAGLARRPKETRVYDRDMAADTTRLGR
ncbi:MAG TPA: WGxxGxxG family protein [Deinococcales bacterium]|nr:WGxxGxxG family protein [Deinococcales bacterium]